MRSELSLGIDIKAQINKAEVQLENVRIALDGYSNSSCSYIKITDDLNIPLSKEVLMVSLKLQETDLNNLIKDLNEELKEYE